MSGAFIDKFSDGADRYRRARPTYPSDLFAALAAVAPGRDLAWDCGTGNGQAAVGLAAHFTAVHATDPSAEQLANATAADRVEYRLEQAEDVSLADRSADLVLAAQSLHWFDLARFYAEASRVLKPGGILAAIGYDHMYVDRHVDRTLNVHLLPLLTRYWAPQNAILWAGYRSIPFPGEEVRLGAHAIYLDWSFADAVGYMMSWSAVRALIAAEGQGPIDSAFAAVAPLWGKDARRVVIPLHLRVARLGGPRAGPD
jgi:SAM-dependent methyltransferase